MRMNIRAMNLSVQRWRVRKSHFVRAFMESAYEHDRRERHRHRRRFLRQRINFDLRRGDL